MGDRVRSPSFRSGLAACAVCLVLLASCSVPATVTDEPVGGDEAARGARRPNVLVILTDDHSTAAVGAYGSTLVPTPHIDRIAREGVRFDRLYCTNPICAPSRASILTGLSSVHNGVMDNTERFDPSQRTYPHVFREHGYRTGLFGKWHLKSTPAGYDRFVVLPGQGHYYNPDFLFSVDGSASGEGAAPIRRRVPGHSTELIADFALDWLFRPGGDASEEPFLLCLQFKAPHRNWMPAPEQLGLLREDPVPVPATLFDTYETRSAAAREQAMAIGEDLHPFYDLKWRGGPKEDGLGRAMDGILARMSPEQRARWDAAYAVEDAAFSADPPVGEELVRWKLRRYLADYLRCIAGVDAQIGRVLAALEERGILDDTIVVYTSDQGFFLGEHGWFDKRFLYEESARMPFVVRYPPRVPAGRVDRSLRQNFDIAPTLLEAAGLPELEGIDGRSFWGAVEGRPESDPPTEVYGHYFEYPGAHSVKRHVGIRTARYKLIHFYHDIDAWELYDLATDPDELVNRADDPALAAVRRDLEARLRRLRTRYEGDPDAALDGLVPVRVEHAALGRPATFDPAPRRSHGGDAARLLTDGEVRSDSRFAPRTRRGWLAWRDGAVTIDLDLGAPVAVDGVSVHVLDEAVSWIRAPRGIELLVSTDGVSYRSVARSALGVGPGGSDGAAESGGPRWVELAVGGETVRAVRLRVEPLAEIPAGDPGAGNEAWLFIDEIAVRASD